MDDLQANIGAGGGGGDFTPAGAHFQDQAYLSGTFGGADSSLVSFSFWVNQDVGTSFCPIFVEDVDNGILNNFGIGLGPSTIQISAADDVTLHDGSTWNFGFPGTGWHHYVGTVSTNHPANSKLCVLYVDDILVPTTLVFDNSDAFTMPLNNMPVGVAALPSGSSPLEGDIAYVWMDAGVSFLSGSTIPELTRRKFISAGGEPVDLGADGSTPTGSAPELFHAGGAATFADNAGTGGSLTLVDGPIVDSVTPPSTTFWEAPVITSNGGGPTASISVAENQTAVTTVAGTVMSGKTPVFGINTDLENEGAYAFSINASTGVLTFVSPPNFEAPTDLDEDNVYVLVVRLGDGLIRDEQEITVTVTDVAD